MKLSNIDNVNVYGDDRSKRSGMTEYKLHPLLVPLIEKLAKKTLGVWEFKASYRFSSSKDEPFDDVEVLEKGQFAGRIRKGQKYHQRRYQDTIELIHHSIKKERGPQNTNRTTNVDAAYRMARKTFGAKAKSEVLQENYAAVKSVLQMGQYNRFAQYMNGMEHIITQFLEDYENLFVPRLDSLQKTKYEALLKHLEHHKIVNSIDEEKLLIVRIDNGMMDVQDIGSVNKEITTYEEDDPNIPEFIRRKVGILKLIEDGKIVKNVGVKVAGNVFGITPEGVDL